MAYRYIADIQTKLGNFGHAIAILKKIIAKEKNLLTAYLTYRMGYNYGLLDNQVESSHWLHRLLTTEWDEDDEVEKWQNHLLKEMVPFIARVKSEPKELLAYVGEKFYVKAALLVSDYKQHEKKYQHAYEILDSLKSYPMSDSKKMEVSLKIIDLALHVKNSKAILEHCKRLQAFYREQGEKTEYEEILYKAALNLDKSYLEKKRANDKDTVRELSELYFEMFGQKGKRSQDMLKIASPYLNLWEAP